MPINEIGIDWISANSMRNYPLEDVASRQSDDGDVMPQNVIADLSLWFSSNNGNGAFVSAVTCGVGIVTVTFNSHPTRPTQSTTPPAFMPLCTVSVPKPVVVGKVYNLSPSVHGAGGYIVFGTDINDTPVKSWRFSDPKSTSILPRCARPFTPLGVRTVGVSSSPNRLTGDVRFLSATPNLFKIFNATRVIDGVSRNCLVFSLVDTGDDSGDTFRKLINPGDRRPAADNCEGTQIYTVNGVSPSCDGVISLNILESPSGDPKTRFQGVARGDRLIVNYGRQIDDICGDAVVGFEVDREDGCDSPCDPWNPETPLDQVLASWSTSVLSEPGFDYASGFLKVSPVIEIPVGLIPNLALSGSVAGGVLVMVPTNISIIPHSSGAFTIPNPVIWIPDTSGSVLWGPRSDETIRNLASVAKTFSGGLSGSIPAGTSGNHGTQRASAFLSAGGGGSTWALGATRTISSLSNFIMTTGQPQPRGSLLRFRLCFIPSGRGYANVEFKGIASDITTSCSPS